VQELVRLLRGNISVQSTPNRGTTFTVVIPVTRSGPTSVARDDRSNPRVSARAGDYVQEALQWLPAYPTAQLPGEPAPVAKSQDSRFADATSFRVVVVDDNADMRDYLRRLLSQHWTVEVFASGREALSAAVANPPHLIITDVMMPEIDGFGLVKVLRESPATSRVPIIMLSARAGEEARIDGLKAGVENYLVKPFSARELVESVRSQLLLRQRSAQFETLVNAAPIGIIVMDEHLRFQQVNPVAIPVFDQGFNVIGRDFIEIARMMWTSEYADELLRIFGNTLATGESYSKAKAAEFRVDRQRTEYYEWRVDRISLPEGTFGLVCYFRDISLEVKAEEALRQSEKLAVVGRMAASISHEINNPLEAVTNLLYLIRTCTDAEQVQTYLDLTERELARVNDIVTHGLRFHRQSTTPREESVSELLQSAAAIYQGRLQSGPASLLCEFHESRKVIGLGGELRQVFANFVGNAFDATLRGGTIFLRTRDAFHPETREPGVRVVIADSGVGMSEATQSRLFEPFFTTKNIAGTGLGLWLSKDILQRHGAILRLKSRDFGPRTGTVFSIFLPANGVRQKSVSSPTFVQPEPVNPSLN
jgi:signal transduction histidine kinase